VPTIASAMDSNAPAIERLRWYIRSQSLQTQMTILTALERGILRGEDMPALEHVMDELRSEIRKAPEKPKRIGNPARLFFQPIGPFIVDDAPSRRHDGNIARACLNPIWSWICRDLAPLDARDYADAASRALLADDLGAAERLAGAFHARVIERLDETLDDEKGEARAQKRLDAYMAPPRVLDDVRDLAQILKSREPLAAIAAQLPPTIPDFEGAQLESTLALVKDAAATGAMLYASVLVLNRLALRWQLVRLATRGAESRSARQLAATPYHVALTLVLADIEETVATHRATLEKGHAAEALGLLRTAHQAMQAVNAELDLSEDSAASRRYAAILSTMSQLTQPRIVSSGDGRRRPVERPQTGDLADASRDRIATSEAELMIRVLRSVQGQESKLSA
jgi:hypothetical protein